MSNASSTGPSKHRHAVAGYWNAVAHIYDSGAGHGIRNAAERDVWIAVLGKCLPAPPARILDLGTGTGFLAHLLNQLGYEVVGIDISLAMLSVAQTRDLQSGVTVGLLNGDVSDLPFKDEAFDGILSRYVLWSLPSPESSLVEWCRVCCVGGTIIAIDGQWWQQRLTARIRHRLGQVLEWWHERNELPEPWPRMDDYYTTDLRESLPLRSQEDPGKVVALFKDAGLEGVNLRWLAEVDKLEQEMLPFRRRLSHQPKFLVMGRVSNCYHS